MTRWAMCFGLLGACAGPPDGVGSPGDSAAGELSCPPSVEIGTGEDEFVELADHAPLTMVHGPQGGWHMLASVRVSGTQPEVHIQYEIIHPESGVRVSDNSYNLALRMEDACVGSYVGMYGYLSVQALVEGELDTPPEILDGDSLILRMEVQDVDFNQAAAEAPVTAVRDAVDL